MGLSVLLPFLTPSDWQIIESPEPVVEPVKGPKTTPSPMPGAVIREMEADRDSGRGQEHPGEDQEEPMECSIPQDTQDRMSPSGGVVATPPCHSPITSSQGSVSTHLSISPGDDDPCGGSRGGASSEEELSPPLQFLCEAHRHLGKMGWCCKDSGALLLEGVATIRRELQVLTRLPPSQREVGLPPSSFFP